MTHLRLPALAIQQGGGRTLYSFAVDGKLLPSFAAISRIRRGQCGVEGYQRIEASAHVAQIRRYLESPTAILPNSIVVAFDQRVRFEPQARRPGKSNGHQFGELIVPVDSEWRDAEKPGFVVDGQQRMAALREAKLDRFEIFVTSFIASGEHEQREQFILVNSTKPLPKSLLYELLPATSGPLPSQLERRKLPAQILELLNTDPSSPFHNLIRTATVPSGIVNDNAILRMLEHSLSDGALYRLKLKVPPAPITEMQIFVSGFWHAAATVFPQAWGLPPRRSRLMHGVGIISLGFLMDAIADKLRNEGWPTNQDFQSALENLKEHCRWTEGYWDFGPTAARKWNDLQFIPRDIRLLSNHLLSLFFRTVEPDWRGRSLLRPGPAVGTAAEVDLNP